MKQASLTVDKPHDSVQEVRSFLSAFNAKAVGLRIPIGGSLEITHRCNLSCVHCYLTSLRERRDFSGEMTTEKIKSVIEDAAALGCMSLLITGGEPLVRQDFAEIYLHAKKIGIVVTVFTNGTLVSGRLLDLFLEFPPNLVEISLYGATEGTYERITGVPGSFRQCMAGIEGLMDKGIHVGLKTMLMTLNRHEFYDIENMAKGLGVSFRFDPAINPCLDGDITPLSFRVAPEDAVEKDFSDIKRVRGWKKSGLKTDARVADSRLYDCGAATVSFHLDPYGWLQPCLMTPDIRYDLTKGSFPEGWQFVGEEIAKRKVLRDASCNGCTKNDLCGYCPGFFRLETGSEDICSSYLCELGKYRFERLKKEG